MKSPNNSRRGFTLIELLTVIAIIGILAAVLFPGVQGVMKKAKQSAASTKLRNIAQSYIVFNSGSKFIKDATWNSASAPTSATTLGQFAAVLALNAGLNTGEIWFVDADSLNDSASFPKQVLLGAAGSETIDPAFITPATATGFMSWTTYTPTNKNLNEQVPLLWTRGLDTAGKWTTAAFGVWGTEGGHIAFGDAHVDWRSDTSANENKFASKKNPGQLTPSWQEAVSAAAVKELKSK
jgi:prepilin-type N-terminal cleavage/methylation domain-containing protein